MNKRFYKYAAHTEIPGHYAYQLPTLLALTGLGTAGGALLGKKKKKLESALFGGISLPALYLAYLYGQKNLGWKGNSFDRFVNKNINNPVHAWRNPLSAKDAFLNYTGDVSVTTPTAKEKSLIYKPKSDKVRLYRTDNKSGTEEDMGYVPNYGPLLGITLDPETNKYISIADNLKPVGDSKTTETSSLPASASDADTPSNTEESKKRIKETLSTTAVP